MPAFTKTVSSLSKAELLSAAATFHFDATGSVNDLRARLKAHMANPDHAPLFTRRERAEWPGRSESPDPSSWHGIGGGAPGQSRSASRSTPTATATPPPFKIPAPNR
ncbi:hypothetical protein B0H13DRAFT_2293318 [Mycena leptocephala]|nr:hypothetical protein B0H13DRAFT_2293318 [Mycena leptocephala]